MKKTAFNEWILGHCAEKTRNYLIHTRSPRFIAEVFSEDDPAGILAGLSYELSDGRSLANFEFWDDFPMGDALLALLQRADEALSSDND